MGPGSEDTEDMEGGEYVEGAEHGEGIGRRGSRMTPKAAQDTEGSGRCRKRGPTADGAEYEEGSSRCRVVRSAAKITKGAEVSGSIDSGEGAEYAEDADEAESCRKCGKPRKATEGSGRPRKMRKAAEDAERRGTPRKAAEGRGRPRKAAEGRGRPRKAAEGRGRMGKLAECNGISSTVANWLREGELAVTYNVQCKWRTQALCTAMVAQGRAKVGPLSNLRHGGNTPAGLLGPQLSAWWRKVAPRGVPSRTQGTGGTHQWDSLGRGWAHGGARWRQRGSPLEPKARGEHTGGTPWAAAGRMVAQ
eukprot:gene12505-biopygen12024